MHRLPAPDEDTAVEAGGLDNATAGFDPRGNVLANDTRLRRRRAQRHARSAPARRPATGTAGAVGGAALRGTYGDLTLNADGSWHYTVDNSLPAVQALRVPRPDADRRLHLHACPMPLGASRHRRS